MDFVKKIIKWWLILGVVTSVIILAVAGIQGSHQKRLTRKINKAVTECDFVKAHDYLDELAVTYKDSRWEMEREYYPTVQKVYEAEMRYLISLDTEESWKRAKLLPLEVDKTIDDSYRKVYRALTDMYSEYAEQLGKEE